MRVASINSQAAKVAPRYGSRNLTHAARIEDAPRSIAEKNSVRRGFSVFTATKRLGPAEKRSCPQQSHMQDGRKHRSPELCHDVKTAFARGHRVRIWLRRVVQIISDEPTFFR